MPKDGNEGQSSDGIHTQIALIAEIRDTHRQRDDLLRAEGSLTRQIKAIGRRMKANKNLTPSEGLSDFATLHLETAKKAIHPGKLEMERRLKKLAPKLPVYEWMKSIPGFGEIGLCQIIGECGDLSNFENPSKVWKYLGLAPKKCYPVGPNGGRMYSRRSRSVMYVIGDSLIKCQGPYREIYLTRKAYEVDMAEAEGLTVAPQAEIPDDKKSEYRSEGHIHRRAQRYMEKHLLKDLWRVWRVKDKEKINDQT